MDKEIECIDGGKACNETADREGQRAELQRIGSISNVTVASRTPLAKPSVADMNSVLGLLQSAISPPMGEAIAAATATDTTMRKSCDIERIPYLVAKPSCFSFPVELCPSNKEINQIYEA